MEKINGLILKNLLESGAHNLSNQRKAVDAMNVFPVPDGDTGTNMSLTILNGISEVTKSGSESLSTVAKIFSRGLLMGARGNSGVILSQIFRGFAQYAKDKEELTVKEFSEALMNGSKMAYKAVMRPTEGTILTVVRESAEYGEIFINDHPEASMEEFVNYIADEANASLQRTPELLDVLKEAHCVDSGAMMVSSLVYKVSQSRRTLQGIPQKQKYMKRLLDIVLNISFPSAIMVKRLSRKKEFASN